MISMSDPLNNLLRKWGEARASNLTKSDADLARRISREVRRQRFFSLPAPRETRLFGNRTSRLALAAAVLLFVLASTSFWLRNRQGMVQPIEVAENRHLPPLPTPSLTLFRSLDALFDHRLAWLADLPHGLEFSLPSADVPGSTTEPVMAVTLVLSTRSGEDSSWKSVWEGTVYTLGNQWTEIDCPDSFVPRLGFWIYPLDPDVLMIDSTLDLRRPTPLPVRSSRIVAPNETVRLMVVDCGTIQYQLCQSVVVLKRSSEAPSS